MGRRAGRSPTLRRVAALEPLGWGHMDHLGDQAPRVVAVSGPLLVVAEVPPQSSERSVVDQLYLAFLGPGQAALAAVRVAWEDGEASFEYAIPVLEFIAPGKLCPFLGPCHLTLLAARAQDEQERWRFLHAPGKRTVTAEVHTPDYPLQVTVSFWYVEEQLSVSLPPL